MNKTKNIWINKQCPFYWKKGQSGGLRGKFKDEKTGKCLLFQIKDKLAGEPGCVYHGSYPPLCFCQSEYTSTDMLKVGPLLWECPFCNEQVTGEKKSDGYDSQNEYDYKYV